MQRDRLRSVLLALQGREALEIADTVGCSPAFVQRWAYTYGDGGIGAVRGRTVPGRKRWLTPEQEARLVQRVKAGATPRDGVAALRGRQNYGILDHEFGKVSSLTGIYKLLKRHGFVCLDPRPRHPRQDPAAAKAFKRRAPFCESREGLPPPHESAHLVKGRGAVRAAGNTDRRVGIQGIAADRRSPARASIDLGARSR